MRGQKPGEIGGIGNAGIHAVAGIGHPQMRGVAADEHAPVAKAVGDQAAADPVFLAEELVFEIGADAEDGADRGVAVDQLEGLVFVG